MVRRATRALSGSSRRRAPADRVDPTDPTDLTEAKYPSIWASPRLPRPLPLVPLPLPWAVWEVRTRGQAAGGTVTPRPSSSSLSSSTVSLPPLSMPCRWNVPCVLHDTKTHDTPRALTLMSHVSPANFNKWIQQHKTRSRTASWKVGLIPSWGHLQRSTRPLPNRDRVSFRPRICRTMPRHRVVCRITFDTPTRSNASSKPRGLTQALLPVKG